MGALTSRPGPSLEAHGGDIWAASRTLDTAPGEIVDFSASVNPLGPSPRALEALRDRVGLLSSYPDPRCTPLAEAIAAYHRIPPQSILVGNGSTEMIYLVARAFGRRTLIPVPSFSDYERSVRVAGGRCRFVGCGAAQAFRIDLGGVARALRRLDTLLVLGNPNNPTGQRHSPDSLKELLTAAARRGIRMAVDEAFLDFWEGDSLVREAPRSRYLIVLRTFTKFFALAGLRVGYLVAHPENVAALRRTKEPWSVNTLAQAAAQASLLDRDYIRRSRAYMEGARPALQSALQAEKGLEMYPSEANYILLRVSAPGSARKLARGLLDRRILIREAGSFRGLGPQYVRLAVKSFAENRLLIHSLESLLR